MELLPILSSLRKHRIPALLIILEIALACAVLCNAVFMIGKRVTDIDRTNAMDESQISVVTLNGYDRKKSNANIPRNLDALRRLNGANAVGVLNTVPLSKNGWNAGFSSVNEPLSEKNAVTAAEYLMGEGAFSALGLQLKEGRTFSSDEYADGKLGASFLPEAHVAIVTEALAARLWPNQSPLGKQMYALPFWYAVVGVVGNVMQPDQASKDRAYYSAFFPLQPSAPLNHYVIRSAPEARDRLIQAAETTLDDLDPEAIAKGMTFESMRAQYFADTSSMAWTLALVCTVMLAVTAFGIVGLTSFWVAQRRRQIGIRRAVGATRGDILNYFRTENFLLTTIGTALGMLLAFGINLYLMHHYEIDRMPWYYLPGGAVALWLLGQLSVLGPALRAASVPPVVATRSL